MKMMYKTLFQETLILSDDSLHLCKRPLQTLNDCSAHVIQKEGDQSQTAEPDSTSAISAASHDSLRVIKMFNKYAHHMNAISPLPHGRPLSCPPRIVKASVLQIEKKAARKRFVSADFSTCVDEVNYDRLANRRKLE
jgi:hypothetical protein